ncbi:hypothetical protein SRHO_G00275890 [Serrasalmus rhombeus]
MGFESSVFQHGAGSRCVSPSGEQDDKCSSWSAVCLGFLSDGVYTQLLLVLILLQGCICSNGDELRPLRAQSYRSPTSRETGLLNDAVQYYEQMIYT